MCVETLERLSRTRKEESWDKFPELLAVPKGFGKAEHFLNENLSRKQQLSYSELTLSC